MTFKGYPNVNKLPNRILFMNLKSYLSCNYITNLHWSSVSSRTIYYPEYYKACDSHWYNEHFILLTSSPLHCRLSIPGKFLYRCIPLFALQEIPVCLKIGRIFMFPERRQHSTCLVFQRLIAREKSSRITAGSKLLNARQ